MLLGGDILSQSAMIARVWRLEGKEKILLQNVDYGSFHPVSLTLSGTDKLINAEVTFENLKEEKVIAYEIDLAMRASTSRPFQKWLERPLLVTQGFKEKYEKLNKWAMTIWFDINFKSRIGPRTGKLNPCRSRAFCQAGGRPLVPLAPSPPPGPSGSLTATILETTVNAVFFPDHRWSCC